MPSFRVTLTIGDLRPGTDPRSVLPAAADAARELTVVEASEVNIVAGSARVTVRFSADDAEIARQVGHHIVASTNRVAAVARWAITQRVGGRWAAL